MLRYPFKASTQMTALLSIAGILFAGQIHAYEQGSYFLFDLIQPEKEATTSKRIAVDTALVTEKKKFAQASDKTEPNSEFEFITYTSFSSKSNPTTNKRTTPTSNGATQLGNTSIDFSAFETKPGDGQK